MDTARDSAYLSHENPRVSTAPYLDDELFESYFDWQGHFTPDDELATTSDCSAQAIRGGSTSRSAHSGSIFQERTDDTRLLPEASPREFQAQDDEWTYPQTVPNKHVDQTSSLKRRRSGNTLERRRVIPDPSQTADVRKSMACLPCRVSKTRVRYNLKPYKRNQD